MSADIKHQNLSTRTKLLSMGRNPDEAFGFVNTPPYRGSTVLYPDADACLRHENRYSYGRRGNPTSEALENLWSELEGAKGTVITPSGLAACTIALLSCLKAGDHLLVTDSVYLPTRSFCNETLTNYGIETTYYDPLIGAGIEALIRPNTRAIFTESPGSQTFEIQDIPAIVKVAKAHNITTLIDNTYATALLFRPLDFGIDISINAATKYPSGHSDVTIGLIAANEKAWPSLKTTHGNLGISLGTDDIYLVLRGLRTMDLRLKEQGAVALKLAEWLETRIEVKAVWHPALPSFAGHKIWKRDFKGAAGLFSIVLQPPKADATKTQKQLDHAILETFLNALTLFGLGYSWGGFESLAIPFNASSYRTATVFNPGGPCVRLQIGLEDFDDLKANLEGAFEAIAKFY